VEVETSEFYPEPHRQISRRNGGDMKGDVEHCH
jgi:hypothetical protein